MRKVLSLFLVLTLAGCASVTIPNYIQDKNPYKRTFYSDFTYTKNTVLQTLKEFGWAVEQEADPGTFDRAMESVAGQGEQVLLFTRVRQTSFFIGSRYARMNIYLRVLSDKATEVEIRYLNITTVPFKHFHDYTNDASIERLFKHIEGLLN